MSTGDAAGDDGGGDGGDVAGGDGGEVTQTLTLPDGAKYVGEVKNNMANGKGVAKADGWEYDGMWKDNQYHGDGMMLYASGNTFTGVFKFHRMFEGTFTWKNGLLVKCGTNFEI